VLAGLAGAHTILADEVIETLDDAAAKVITGHG